eukprot:scpid74733/ scgid19663/ PiggyBac transposable element-derived protein 4
MEGVDKNDVMTQTYTGLRTSYKRYKKIAFHLIEEAVQNTFVIPRLQPGKRLEHYAFIMELIKSLLAEAGASVSASGAGQQRLVGKHHLGFIPATEKKGVLRRWCVVCYVRNVPSETRFYCRMCPDRPSLRAIPCQEIYHTRGDYTRG